LPCPHAAHAHHATRWLSPHRLRRALQVRGVYDGAVGMVSKPMEGMEKGGVLGFIPGVAEGIKGAWACRACCWPPLPGAWGLFDCWGRFALPRGCLPPGTHPARVASPAAARPPAACNPPPLPCRCHVLCAGRRAGHHQQGGGGGGHHQQGDAEGERQRALRPAPCLLLGPPCKCASCWALKGCQHSACRRPKPARRRRPPQVAVETVGSTVGSTLGWKSRAGRVGRRRLPRCIRGNRLLQPFHIKTALGLALLQQAAAAPGGLLAGTIALPGSAAAAAQALNLRQDAYEAHFVLPHDMVAVRSTRPLPLPPSAPLAAPAAPLGPHLDALGAARSARVCTSWQEGAHWGQSACPSGACSRVPQDPPPFVVAAAQGARAPLQVLTNARVLLVRCAGFAELEAQVGGGSGWGVLKRGCCAAPGACCCAAAAATAAAACAGPLPVGELLAPARLRREAASPSPASQRRRPHPLACAGGGGRAAHGGPGHRRRGGVAADLAADPDGGDGLLQQAAQRAAQRWGPAPSAALAPPPPPPPAPPRAPHPCCAAAPDQRLPGRTRLRRQ
jgi:hypothetical protein